jgi:hypothetical protein
MFDPALQADVYAAIQSRGDLARAVTGEPYSDAEFVNRQIVRASAELAELLCQVSPRSEHAAVQAILTTGDLAARLFHDEAATYEWWGAEAEVARRDIAEVADIVIPLLALAERLRQVHPFLPDLLTVVALKCQFGIQRRIGPPA